MNEFDVPVMSCLLETVNEFNDLILQGKHLEAVEKYFDADAILNVNGDLAISGKTNIQAFIQEGFHGIRTFTSARPLHVAIGEGISMTHWSFDYSESLGGGHTYTAVLIQEWTNGQIIREKRITSTNNIEKNIDQ